MTSFYATAMKLAQQLFGATDEKEAQSGQLASVGEPKIDSVPARQPHPRFTVTASQRRAFFERLVISFPVIPPDQANVAKAVNWVAEVMPRNLELVTNVDSISSDVYSTIVNARAIGLRLIDHKLEEAAQNGMPAYKVACKAGCSYCCRTQLIVLDVAEAVCLVRYIESLGDRKEYITKSLLGRLQQGRSQTTNGPKGTPCIFLGPNDECSAYGARPAICQSYNSSSRKSCKDFALGRTGPPKAINAYPQIIMAAVNGMFMPQVWQWAGLEHRVYEMNQLLSRIYSSPEKVAAWAAGHPTLESDLLITSEDLTAQCST